jgi:hypothetical protein
MSGFGDKPGLSKPECPNELLTQNDFRFARQPEAIAITFYEQTYRYRSSRYCATVSVAMVRTGGLRQRLLFD